MFSKDNVQGVKMKW